MQPFWRNLCVPSDIIIIVEQDRSSALETPPWCNRLVSPPCQTCSPPMIINNYKQGIILSKSAFGTKESMTLNLPRQDQWLSPLSDFSRGSHNSNNSLSLEDKVSMLHVQVPGHEAVSIHTNIPIQGWAIVPHSSRLPLPRVLVNQNVSGTRHQHIFLVGLLSMLLELKMAEVAR